ncbi:hypothetical protein [Cryobacterium sp. PH31-O1]|uniref:hypothetical protein n=1 Tax=Cryobacterium sp. PH31-O1 TaxID=3046306 RepID=UPI0024BAAA6C|nr:hypothetical protein [Cryobacterium sp. PH31-O1]MDJ0338257.1 hypothetical protein [Cryobacterium sp. PH31-O1]
MADATFTRDAAAWFPILAARFDAAAPHIATLRSYMFEDPNISPPLPEMGKNTKAAWSAFQKKACPALAPLIVSSAGDRIRYQGVVVGPEREETEKKVQRIIRDSYFEVTLGEAVHAALTDGESYLLTARGDDGKAVITAEDRRFCIVAADPIRPSAAPRAALKVWRDADQQADFAWVWDGTVRAMFSRPMADEKTVLTAISGGSWKLVGTVEVGAVPFVVIRPAANGQGSFEPHLSTIDRVYHGLLNRLVSAAMQAFQQRYLKGNLPTADDDGNEIDYSAIFENSPGALWDLPEGVDLAQLAQTDIRPMLDASKDDLRDLSAVARTPLAALNPGDGANQSAEGAQAAKDSLIFRVSAYLDRIRPAVELALVRALRIEDPTALADGESITILFSPPQRISEYEKFQALVLAKSADVPFVSRMLTVGGYSAAEVERMEAERLDEQMTLAAITAPNASDPGSVAIDPADMKSMTESMGALIRAGATPESAAQIVGLTGLEFLPGMSPVTLKSSLPDTPTP